MDPTAPKDNPTSATPQTQGQGPNAAPPAVSTNPWSSQPPPIAEAPPASGGTGQIQTGQFVSVGGDTPPPASPASATLPPLPITHPSANGPILGAVPEPNPIPQTPQPPLSPLPNTLPAEPEFAPNQPNPTPYAPPPNTPNAQSSQGGSKLKSLKLIAIIAGILVLVAIIGVLVWFFVINGKSNQAASTQNTGTNVTEQLPLPKIDKGGFGDLPQATASAQATGSATPSANR